MEDDLRESINEHIQLIKNLSSLSNSNSICKYTIHLNKLREIMKWESNILSEFIQESDRTKEKKKQ